ncbi:unnamed protein product, partial [Mesorhabditis spiculigera]
MLKLPEQLIADVLDRLEPEELIKLQRTTKAFRRRINHRGLLPGRVQTLYIHGQEPKGKQKKASLKWFELGVKSRDGTMILASNHRRSIFHLHGKK